MRRVLLVALVAALFVVPSAFAAGPPKTAKQAQVRLVQDFGGKVKCTSTSLVGWFDCTIKWAKAQKGSAGHKCVFAEFHWTKANQGQIGLSSWCDKAGPVMVGPPA